MSSPQSGASPQSAPQPSPTPGPRMGLTVLANTLPYLLGAAAGGVATAVALEVIPGARAHIHKLHPFLSHVVIGAGAIAGSLLALIPAGKETRSEKIIMRILDLAWTRNDFCRGWLITGTPGSGKTEALKMLMHLLSRHEPDWGGLFIDEKGFFVDEVLPLLRTYKLDSSICELRIRPRGSGPEWIPPYKTNILGDEKVRTSQYVDAILTVAETVASGEKDKGFFKTQAGLHIGAAIDLYRGLREWQRLRGVAQKDWVAPTLRGVYEILTSEEDYRNLLMKRTGLFVKREDAAEAKAPRGEVSRKETIAPDYQGVEPNLLVQAVEHFRKRYWNVKAQEQMEGVRGTITNYLKWFADDNIHEVFGAEESNFGLELIDQSKKICVSLPQEYAIERRYICSLLKVLAYSHARARNPLKQKYNLGIIWQDEAQRFLMPIDGDVDILRQYSFTTVICTQLQPALSKALGGEKNAEPIIANLRNRIIFQAANESCAEDSAKYIGKGLRKKVSYSSNGSGKTTKNWQDEVAFFVEPYQLRQLPKFVGVFGHASGRHRVLQFAPMNDAGVVPDWFRDLALPKMRRKLSPGVKGPIFVKAAPPKPRIAG